MFPPLSEDQIRILLAAAKLDTEGTVQKVAVGFSNDVFSVADKYIVKAGKSERDQKFLEREVYFCNVFKDKLPAPKIIVSDTSRQVFDRPYIIYEKIEGDNLYNTWHSYDTAQRKKIIGEICSYLKVINNTPHEEYARLFNVNSAQTWQRKLTSIIDRRLRTIEKRSLLPQELVDEIERFVEQYAEVLKEQRVALTYYDVHFDNFLVRNGQIVGMLDFERTKLLSIDYVLSVVKRMVDFPRKYASEYAEQLVRPEDYRHLMDWYKESYPELFEFADLEQRLALYGIEHGLEEVIVWPNADEAIQEMKNYLARN